MVQINEIKFKLKKKKRIGRGGKRGNYSGRGIKGQKARAGAKIRPALRDIILKFPKKRGVGNIKIEKKILEINLDWINKFFNDGELVTPERILNKIRIPKSYRNLKIKILGRGKLTKKVIFSQDFLFSKRALEKIKNQGGDIK